MDKNFDIADCIVALIQGVATQEQVTRLDAWLEEADENRRLFLYWMNLPMNKGAKNWDN